MYGLHLVLAAQIVSPVAEAATPAIDAEAAAYWGICLDYFDPARQVCLDRCTAAGHDCDECKDACRTRRTRRYRGVRVHVPLQPEPTNEFFPSDPWVLLTDWMTGEVSLLASNDCAPGRPCDKHFYAVPHMDASLGDRGWGSLMLFDHNADGHMDVVLGDPDNSEVYDFGGAIHFWYGPLDHRDGGAPDVTVYGDRPYLGFGDQVSAKPGPDGDGLYVGGWDEPQHSYFEPGELGTTVPPIIVIPPWGPAGPTVPWSGGLNPVPLP